jgi:hypothetical protein
MCLRLKICKRRQIRASFFIAIISNLNLFVAGSIHQGSESFSEISRGRQCSFMSFSALLFAQNLTFERWTASNVNQILAEGDQLLYLDAFESRSILDTETLSLDYMSREMRQGRMGLILLGGWGSISLPDRFAYTVHIYNFVRYFIKAFLKDFLVGVGGAFFGKGSFCEKIC